ncbi:queuosine precursor transporter [Arthrobacter castelli]|uniref:queuosine precursor transporter n=1 Tax=Arthrobacter castelli TaxID=271431 RepID=UPI000402ECED|nr:queuosine precursor transporter [Arthrobacter castelli]
MTQLADQVEAKFASRGSSHFDILLALFCVVLILSNVGASKGVAFGPIITDGGFFLFPIAYIIGDVLSEVYGFRAARRAIITGFVTAALAALTFWVIVALPAADFYTNQDALASVLMPVPLIVLASLLGFVAGQTLNSWVLVRIKDRTRERHLWARLMGSTGVGEFADTLIFCSIAASVIGITSAGDFINYVLVGFLYKTAVEVLFLPVTTLVIRWVKKREPSYGVAA